MFPSGGAVRSAPAGGLVHQACLRRARVGGAQTRVLGNRWVDLGGRDVGAPAALTSRSLRWTEQVRGERSAGRAGTCASPQRPQQSTATARSAGCVPLRPINRAVSVRAAGAGARASLERLTAQRPTARCALLLLAQTPATCTRGRRRRLPAPPARRVTWRGCSSMIARQRGEVLGAGMAQQARHLVRGTSGCARRGVWARTSCAAGVLAARGYRPAPQQELKKLRTADSRRWMLRGTPARNVPRSAARAAYRGCPSRRARRSQYRTSAAFSCGHRPCRYPRTGAAPSSGAAGSAPQTRAPRGS